MIARQLGGYAVNVERDEVEVLINRANKLVPHSSNTCETKETISRLTTELVRARTIAKFLLEEHKSIKGVL